VISGSAPAGTAVRRPPDSWTPYLLAQLYPDGHYRVSDLDRDDKPSMAQAPGGFVDLMDGLNYRNTLDHGPDDQIDVRVITHADGSRACVVDRPPPRCRTRR
jgi:hypothetical protein